MLDAAIAVVGRERQLLTHCGACVSQSGGKGVKNPFLLIEVQCGCTVTSLPCHPACPTLSSASQAGCHLWGTLLGRSVSRGGPCLCLVLP